jgi:hypothetical protein
MATFTWISAADGDWNTGTNWSGGTAPNLVPNDAAADVVIDAVPTGTITQYTVTIVAGAADTVSTLQLNPVNNALGPNTATGYIGAALEVDGTLTFAPGSAGAIDGPLQNLLIMSSGTIVNAGTVNAFVQAVGNSVFTGTNGIYFTNWLQALGTVTVDMKSIAELSGTTLFDGIFEAKGPTAVVNLGGSGGGLAVNIVKIEGPPLIPEGWTELFLEANGSSINEWNGTAYVPIEQTLATIGARGTVDVLQARDYTTTNALTIENGGVLNLQAGILTTAGITIAAGGIVQGNAISASNFINNGTIISTGSGLVLSGTISGGGAINFGDKASTLEVGAVGAATRITMLGGDTLKVNAPLGLAGTIAATVGDTIILNNIIADGASVNAGTLVVTSGSQVVATLNLAGDYSAEHFTVSEIGGNAQLAVAAGAPVCYAKGTRILTEDGEVPVEDLTVGKCIINASGQSVPIKWIGRRRLDCRRHVAPRKARPVRIRAGSLGPALPKRDLVVSPQHAIFVNNVLIPAKCLINGLNVTQDEVDTVEYYHVELPRHDLLIAEGLPAESYLENNDRGMFENHEGPIILHPSFSGWAWDALGYAELKLTGPEVEAARMTLLANAKVARVACA